MEATRREFLLGSLGVALAGKLDGTDIWPGPYAMQAADSRKAPYGSSNFGNWIEDEFGLPAFQYTCNQTTEVRAITQLEPGILAPTEHIHQVGNDRITALASNFGHVRVRQDEGCPKLLNDVDAGMHQFGGGLGYLTDGHESLTTYYDGSDAKFQRTFGVSYFRKLIRGKSYSVRQTISAPFGDDPVLISQATITNHGEVAATVRWVGIGDASRFNFPFARPSSRWRESGRRPNCAATWDAGSAIRFRRSAP